MSDFVFGVGLISLFLSVLIVGAGTLITRRFLRQHLGSWNIRKFAFAFLLVAASLFVVLYNNLSPNPADDMLSDSLVRLAKVYVRIDLRDERATFEKVVLHPTPGPGSEGLTYVCGNVRPSYSISGDVRRFVVLISDKKVTWFGQNIRIDRMLTEMCEAAPLPMTAIESGNNEWHLKAQKSSPPPNPLSENISSSREASESTVAVVPAPQQPSSSVSSTAQSTAISPQDASVYFKRGSEYLNKGDNDRAIAAYTEAIRINPNYEDAYVNRGTAYSDKGDYDRAIADYNEAIRLDPKDKDAYNNRGIAYQNKGDNDRAIADYRRALSIDPSFQLAKDNLQELESASSLPAAQSTVPQAQPDLRSQLQQRSREFIVALYRTTSQVTYDDFLTTLGNLYAETVRYYGKELSRDAVIAQAQRYLERWPVHQYTLDDSSVTIDCEEASLKCAVKGKVQFDTRSSDRNERISGLATFEYSLSFQAGNKAPRITVETGNVLSRNKSALNDNKVSIWNPPSEYPIQPTEMNPVNPTQQADTQQTNDRVALVYPGSKLWATNIFLLCPEMISRQGCEMIKNGTGLKLNNVINQSGLIFYSVTLEDGRSGFVGPRIVSKELPEKDFTPVDPAIAKRQLDSSEREYQTKALAQVGRKFWVGDYLGSVSICPTPTANRFEGKCNYLERGVGLTINNVVTVPCQPTKFSHCAQFYYITSDDGRTGYISVSEKLASSDPIAADKAIAQECARKGQPKIGMTMEQVAATAWGKPTKVNRTVTASGTREQHVYELGYTGNCYASGYLYFDDGLLSGIQDSR